jgi:hypothetical protein
MGLKEIKKLLFKTVQNPGDKRQTSALISNHPPAYAALPLDGAFWQELAL